jgi:hypothetical protein
MSQDSLLLSLRECSHSDWYFSPEDHRCPHDAWVESVTISEPASGERCEKRELQIQILLLGAYHDGTIEFTYRQVQNYSLLGSRATGHGDWLRDEVEDREGSIVHDIELTTGKFRIDAKAVEYKWTASPDRTAIRQSR